MATSAPKLPGIIPRRTGIFLATKRRKPWKPKKPFEEMGASTRRIAIRPFQEKDFAAWQSGYLGRHKRKNRFESRIPPRKKITKALFQKVLREQRSRAKARDAFSFAIFDRKTGEALGHVGYYLVNPRMRWANLGYELHNQHWGKGITSEAARLCLALGFGPLDFHRIEASCEVPNKASAKVALKAGLKPEGKRLKFFSHDGGVDLLVFAENQIDYRRKKRRGR